MKICDSLADKGIGTVSIDAFQTFFNRRRYYFDFLQKKLKKTEKELTFFFSDKINNFQLDCLAKVLYKWAANFTIKCLPAAYSVIRMCDMT